jgi:hypothetical protein
MKKWLTRDRFRRIEVLAFLVLVGHIVLLASRSKAVTAPLTWQYVVDNPLQDKLSFAYMNIVEIPVVYATATLLGLFAIALLLKVRAFRAATKADEKAGISRYRWYELGIGGGLIATYAAQLAGAYNPAIHIAMIAAGIVFGMAGSRIEVDHAAKIPVPKQTVWTMLLSALIVLSLLGQQIIGGLLNSASTPEYIYGIAGAAVAYWLMHAAVILLSRRRKNKATITAILLEHRLITLLVLAAIAWQVVFFVG